jgi:hypothetical protein
LLLKFNQLSTLLDLEQERINMVGISQYNG